MNAKKGYNNWPYSSSSSSSSSSSVSFSGLPWFRAKQDAARNIRGKKIRGLGGAAAGFMFPVCLLAAWWWKLERQNLEDQAPEKYCVAGYSDKNMTQKIFPKCPVSIFLLYFGCLDFGDKKFRSQAGKIVLFCHFLHATRCNEKFPKYLVQFL